MFKEYVPICFAVKKCNVIYGRKKFQKMVYLSKEVGIPFHETFVWNNYGPYSEQLAAEIDSLCKMEFLSEAFDGKEYSYKITQNGENFLEKSVSEFNDILQYFENILKILNEYESMQLEKFASIKFLLNEGYDISYINTFLNYSKNYSNDEIEKGKNQLFSLLKDFEEMKNGRKVEELVQLV